jgi:hypothetical protein
MGLYRQIFSEPGAKRLLCDATCCSRDDKERRGGCTAAKTFLCDAQALERSAAGETPDLQVASVEPNEQEEGGESGPKVAKKKKK